MRATEPWRLARMRSGRGSLSRILDCSVEGPRGAKLFSGDDDMTGDGGADPLPSPGMVVSTQGYAAVGGFIIMAE